MSQRELTKWSREQAVCNRRGASVSVLGGVAGQELESHLGNRKRLGGRSSLQSLRTPAVCSTSRGDGVAEEHLDPTNLK